MPGLVEIRPQSPPTPTPDPLGSPPSALDQHLAHFRRRVLTDALLEGNATYWRRRSHDFARVGTPECDLIALNCRRRADLAHDLGLDEETERLLDLITPIAQAMVDAHLEQLDARAAAWE